jgi:hypothetical protein
MKRTIFWDVTPYSLVEVQRLGGLYCRLLHSQNKALLDACLKSNFNPEDGGGIVLRNVIESLPDYLVSHPRR